jgi:c-di-GMP-related signal transduction protein
MEDKVIFISYDRVANYIIGSHKKIRAGRDSYYTGESSLVDFFPHEFYLLDQSLIEPSTVETAKNMGKKFVVYTVNTEEEYKKLRKL